VRLGANRMTELHYSLLSGGYRLAKEREKFHGRKRDPIAEEAIGNLLSTKGSQGGELHDLNGPR